VFAFASAASDRAEMSSIAATDGMRAVFSVAALLIVVALGLATTARFVVVCRSRGGDLP